MAIKKETLAALLVQLGVAADAVAATTMITEEKENDPAIPEGTLILSKDQAVTRDKVKYEQGKKAGEGMTIDAIFTAELPDYTGKKDAATLTAELVKKGQTESGKDVETRVKERDTTIATLRGNITKMEQENAQHAVTIEKKNRQTDLLMWTAHMKPDNLTPEQWVTILEMDNELVKDESGQTFVKRNGAFIQDPKLATNVPAKDAIVAYVNERKLGKVEVQDDKGKGGRGGEDSKGAPKGIRTKTQLEAYFTENKIDPKSEKARQETNRITTEATDFDWAS